MPTTQEYINSLKQDLTNLKGNLSKAGVEVTDTDNFSTLSFKAGNIPQEDLSEELNTQDTLIATQEVSIDDIKKALVGKGSGSSPRLPKDYQEVEYIESTGTQYINTEYFPNDKTKMRIKFINKVKTGDTIIGYHHSDSDCYRFFNYNNDTYLDLVQGYSNYRIYTTTFKINSGDLYELEVGNRFVNNLKDNANVLYGTSLTFTNRGTSIYINGNKSFSQNIWYYAKIYEDDILVRNLIPCYRKEDNKTGMYDLVNKVFYQNLGTEEFLKGKDNDTIGETKEVLITSNGETKVTPDEGSMLREVNIKTNVGGIEKYNIRAIAFNPYQGEILDLSDFPYSLNLNQMYQMLLSSTNLKYFILGNKLKTTDVTTIQNLCHSCSSLLEASLTYATLNACTNAQGSFMECRYVKKIDLRNWTNNGTVDMYYCFYNTYRLEELYLDKLDLTRTSNWSRYVFNNTGYSLPSGQLTKVYVKDEASRTRVLNVKTNWTTDNVIIAGSPQDLREA